MKRIMSAGICVALCALGLATASPASAEVPPLPQEIQESIARHGAENHRPEVVAAGVADIDDAYGDSVPYNDCAADIRNLEIDYHTGFLSLGLHTQCVNYLTSEWWVYGVSNAQWFLDATGDGYDDFAGVVFNDGNRPIAALYDVRGNDPVFLCEGAIFNDYYRFGGQFDPACIGNPAGIQVQALMVADENPYGTTCVCPFDTAPDDVYTTTLSPFDPSTAYVTGDGPGASSLGAGGAMMVFARGQDDGLYARRYTGSVWEPWFSLGGIVRGTPSAASMGAGQLDAFIRGMDGALWTRHFDGSHFTPWTSLGGILSTPPAVVSPAPGVLDVFVAGFDRAMYHKRLSGGVWSGWTNLGGIISAMPAAASPGTNVVELFARGRDGALWTQRYDGAWSGWSSLGGLISSAPAATSATPGVVDVFARGLYRQLYTRTSDPSSGWTSLGGVTYSGPAAISAAPGEVDVFVQGQDSALYQNERSNSPDFNGWVGLGGIIK